MTTEIKPWAAEERFKEWLEGIESSVNTREFTSWHPAARWSYFATEDRVFCQWGNPFRGLIMQKELREALDNGRYEETDSIDRMLMGW